MFVKKKYLPDGGNNKRGSQKKLRTTHNLLETTKRYCPKEDKPRAID